MTSTTTVPNAVTTLDELRSILGTPGEGAVGKELRRLDRFSRYFIERSPFVLLSSADSTGRCDVSPKGDAPGFVAILDDHTIVVPDRTGNRRGDTLLNILEVPQIGMLFLIPDVEETLRVNGTATITSDSELLSRFAVDGKSPKLGIAVDVQEVYFHCAKAFKRSKLWKSDTWQGRGELPSLGQIMAEQLRIEDMSGEELNCEIEEAYRTKLY